MTIDELLENYRNVFDMTEVEKSERFERLMRNFLLTYPVWRGKISEVWRWKDFPYRDDLGGKDLGIDLVVKTNDGDFWAAQCKFYAESTTIEKKQVDSFISNSGRTFNDGKHFTRRLWISTSDKFNDNARESIKNQSPDVEIINLDKLRRAQVDWLRLDKGFTHEDAITVRELRDYQREAVDKAREYFKDYDRGKLIMACGTGKTFTALKIAETIAPDGKILFLVPSISLLSQTLEEWVTHSVKPINAVCVCSDATATASFDDEIVDVNLPLPAMTDPVKISNALKNLRGDGLTVIFSTYQSIEVVHELHLNFDLIICDEAHRTTAALNKAERKRISAQNNSALGEHSVFTAVHDQNFIQGKKRLYMTATPKLYKTEAKESAKEKDLTVWSMDDVEVFGRNEPIYSISFAKAASIGCLSHYKVFILTVNESFLNAELRKAINDKNDALKIDNTLKIIGCITALSKKMDDKSARLIKDDPNKFMHTAVAFFSSIAEAEQFKTDFARVQQKYFAAMSDAEKNSFVCVNDDVVFGSKKEGKTIKIMPATERAAKLYKLKTTPRDGNICNILNNVRCLAEGVDVPALDAIIFLAPKKSQVEIVQAVGRVMRTAPDKKFGYIIIPVVVPLSKSPEDALDRDAEFKDVWKIINAIRAHDENMNIEIERIRNTLTSNKKDPDFSPSDKIIISNGKPQQLVLEDLLRWEDFQYKIYARMVEHVGNSYYWIQWAYKVADIVERHIRRIKEIIDTDNDAKRDFDNFVQNLKHNINPAVTDDDAIDILAQHLITRPIFEALFENYSFAKNNPVSIAMQKILDRLDRDGMSKDREIFNRLYEQVRKSCEDMGDAASRQRIIIRLYDNFFRIALKKTAEKLGIVYTPVEVVDFILRSVDDVLYKNFGRRLTDKNIHVLDPFAGTGTFLVRLIQSGLIKPRDLLRKYHSELHANEIVLLAYYIAAVNIENAFHDAAQIDYSPFPGICFTDTFKAAEDDDNAKGQIVDKNFRDPMEINSARVQKQQDTRIEVIIGNPPYSVGQRSANDNNQNVNYEKLKTRIEHTYAAKTAATLKRALYDSYIKAFRWASDRISDGGVIGFVTNAGWLDGAAMDGLRKCFAEEFSEIYVFNLRGNQRTQGETSRREGGKIFGSGSRAPIAITILVKKPAQVGKAEIFYHDIGDYLSREEKLDAIKRLPSVLSDEFKPLTPNERGDWINQRGDDFDSFIPLTPKTKFDGAAQSFFITNSRGLTTARDAWAYNFSRSELERNMRTTIDYYNTHKPEEVDTTKIVWVFDNVQDKLRGRKYVFDAAQIVESYYRPFCKANLYYDQYLNQRRYQMPKFFPTGREENLLICVPGVGDSKNFSTFIVNKIPDLGLIGAAQCFPMYWYEEARQGTLSKDFGSDTERRDGISDWAMRNAQCVMRNDKITKEDIFYYVYGFLHLPSYRAKFANELKKSLPRIILVDDADKFWRLSRAGRELAAIHLNYEQQPPAEVQLEIRNEELGIKVFRVEKMRLSKDKTTLKYNEHITIKNIPPQAFEYVVNGRSPLEWIIERYQIKTDEVRRITNDPNAWATEHNNPRYILDLVLSSITVSLKTLDIVESLPEVDFGS